MYAQMDGALYEALICNPELLDAYRLFVAALKSTFRVRS